MPTEDELRGALAAAPDDQNLWLSLGNLLRDQDRFEEAGAIYEQAVSRSPHDARAHRELGVIRLDLGRETEAIGPLERAIELDPGDAKAHNCLGFALERCGRRSEALDAFRASIELDPSHPYAHINIVFALERCDRIGEARHYLDLALRRFPEERGLVLPEAIVLKREGRFREAIARLESEARDEDQTTQLRAKHELARLYDRVGETERAFRRFVELNAEATRTLGLTPSRKAILLRYLEAYRATVTESWARSWLPHSVSSDACSPVFILGFARSGTTLLQQMLGCHPSVHVAGEAPAIWQLEGSLRAKDADYPAGLASLTEQEAEGLRQRYFSTHRTEPDWVARDTLVDKNPLIVPLVPLLARIFPRSRLVLSLRHPCDVVLSCFMHLSNPSLVAEHFFDLGDIVNLYGKSMDLWQRYERVFPLLRVHKLRYEDLVAEPGGTMRGLLAFLGLAWDEAVLRHHERSVSSEGLRLPGYDQVREPLHRRGRYRWHRYRSQLAPYLPRLEPYCRRFGYEI